MARLFFLFFTLVATAGFLGSWSSRAPQLWEGWEVHNPANTQPVDHSAWDALLKKYLRTDDQGLNRFAYARVTPADRKALKAYIAALSRITITERARGVQLAYWINLYNALTIDVVLDHYPVKSIQDIDISGLLASGPWGRELVTVEDTKMTLDNIEHEILRPIWKDPRVHYAVNCASVGCPNLQPVAFTARNTEQLLDKGARDYVNSPRGVTVSGNAVTVSKIYSWFAYDFGNSEQRVLDHLVRYASPDRAARLRAISRIADTHYDWSLNE